MSLTILITQAGVTARELARIAGGPVDRKLGTARFPSHHLLSSSVGSYLAGTYAIYSALFSGSFSESAEPNVLSYAKYHNLITSIMSKGSVFSDLATAFSTCALNNFACIVQQLNSARSVDFAILGDYTRVKPFLAALPFYSISVPGSQLLTHFPCLNFVYNGVGPSFYNLTNETRSFQAKVRDGVNVLKNAGSYLNIIDISIYNVLQTPEQLAAEQAEADLITQYVLGQMGPADNLLVISAYGARNIQALNNITNFSKFVSQDTFAYQQSQLASRIDELRVSTQSPNRSVELLFIAGAGPAFESGKLIENIDDDRYLNQVILNVIAGHYTRFEELTNAEAGSWFMIGCAVFGAIAIGAVVADIIITVKRRQGTFTKEIDLRRAETKNFLPALVINDDPEVAVQDEV